MYEIYIKKGEQTTESRDLIYYSGMPVEDRIILNPHFSQELGKAGELTFTILPENPIYLNTLNTTETRYSKLKSTIYLKKDNKLKWTGRVLNEQKNFYGQKDLYCEGRLAFLNDTICHVFSYGYGVAEWYDGDTWHHAGKLSLRQLLEKFITMNNNHQVDDRDIVLGDVTVAHADGQTTTFALKNNDYDSVYNKLMESFCENENLGGYFSFHYGGNDGVTPYLDYLNFGEGLETEQHITFGENLLDLTEYIDTANVFTIIFPLGCSTTDYFCTAPTHSGDDGHGDDGNIVNVIKDSDKKQVLWNHLRSKHRSVANAIKNSSTPPDNDDFINTYFKNSETGPRLSIFSVNIAPDPGRPGQPDAHFEYLPTPNLWSSDEFVKKYGRIETTVTYDDIDDPNVLLTKGLDYLNKRSLILSDEIALTAVDLKDAGVDVDELWLGDLVVVDDIVHGFSGRMQCTKIDIDIENPANNVFTFGQIIYGFTDKQLEESKKTIKADKKLSDAVDSISKITAVDASGSGTNYARKSDVIALQDATNERFASIESSINNIPQLPVVSSADNNKILTVSNGVWAKGESSTTFAKKSELDTLEETVGDIVRLPIIDSSDNGKILSVVNGEWAVVENSGPAGGLPSGYVYSEYIRSTGTQYIDTGIVAKTGTKVELNFQFDMTPEGWGSIASIVSAISSNGVHIDLLCADLNDKIYMKYGNNTINSNTTISVSTNYFMKAEASFALQKIIIDNAVKATTSYQDIYNIDRTYTLFAANNNGVIENGGWIRLYSCKIYSYDQLVRDFVPCITNDANQEAGLYDLVSKTFFGNKGTGYFRV